VSVQSRKAVREEIGALLTTRLTGATVYPDQPSSFDGQSPVVVVASAGSEREGIAHRTFGGPIAPQFALDVYVFVLSDCDERRRCAGRPGGEYRAVGRGCATGAILDSDWLRRCDKHRICHRPRRLGI
jgi:hypothetical protein